MKRLPLAEDARPIDLRCDGRPVRAYAGDSVAVALSASDVRVLSRSLKYHRPRGFFCLEGHCGACLMRVDGVPNVRACMEPCRDGMEVAGQNAYPSPDLDVLGAVDWLFPQGMDHHTLMTGSRVLNSVVNRMVRQLGGLGELPDRPAPAFPEPAVDEPDVAVVGAGPAGLAAATAAAAAGADVLLVDEHDVAGGSEWADPRAGRAAVEARVDAARRAGVRFASRSTAVAFYPEDDGGLLAVASPERLTRVRARRYVYATGGYAINQLFVNNDRPGVMAARAVGRLLVRHRVVAGTRAVVVGRGDYPAALAAALRGAGSDVVEVDGDDARVVGVRGRVWVKAVDVDRGGRVDRVPCDLVAVWDTPSPASEAPRQHGCAVRFDPARGGFAVEVDADGRTSVAGVFACGDVCGFVGPRAAADQGERAGATAAREALA